MQREPAGLHSLAEACGSSSRAGAHGCGSPHRVSPAVILCPQWNLPPPTPTSWPSQVTPQHKLGFTNPCGEGRHWVAKLLPSHGFRRAGQARGLARNAVTPAQLVRAGCLQQQQELGRPQPMVRRAVGVPEPHTAWQEGSLGRQQGNTWPRISQVYQG